MQICLVQSDSKQQEQNHADKQWVTLTKAWPWLRSTEKETLGASPFDYSYQLFSFIEGMKGRRRNITISGTPLRTKRGLSCINTLISKGFFPSYTVEITHDDRAMVRSSQLKTLASTLALITNGPLTKLGVKQLQEQALKKFKLTTGRNLRNDKWTRLSLISEKVNGLNEQYMIQEIMDMKKGIIGYYQRRQTPRYDQSSGGVYYTGPGVWVGKFDELSLEIHIDTHEGVNRIQRVVVGKEPSSMADFIRGLNMLALEHDIMTDHRSMKARQEGGAYRYVQNRRCVSRTVYSIPVFRDSAVPFCKLRDPQKLRVSFGDVIRLELSDGPLDEEVNRMCNHYRLPRTRATLDLQRYTTVLSFKPSPLDFDPSVTLKDKAWISISEHIQA